ncbi:DUF1656 domain-containing protein [Novosphingobium mangrovi (ex Huang et al. 2023)]|uniref:DUF1656 domain-containing protein n=1 Tax=Novosphingobium mangrovi (ex Huang et al. 2023) TaxID=2976432 RepID=A0ABT2I1L7_9SPHN|nr:DUF1656 domain-containing protein [Novosphingobium mangrovi (ex Huang et al. 2023)]MCT2398696.1 DUF1656 domain-containing protein [Novosphingobium mangrovi (ex Huang et al. 2023)]
MTGEVSISGLFVPTLLLLAIVALLISMATIRLLNLSGFYRFVSYKALVDLAIFILILGGLSLVATHTGFQP